MRGSKFRAVCSANASGRSPCVSKTTGALGSKAPSCRCDDKDKSRLDNKAEVGVITGCCQKEHVQLSSRSPQEKNMGELLEINGKANKASFYIIFKVW